MNQVSFSFVMDSSSAVFSPCRRYRYSLHRQWNPTGTTCAFIGLNPSTADELADDPTVRRCIAFAKRWGHGSLAMLNLFPLRSTDPSALKGASIPANVIKANVDEIILRASHSARVVVCWGTHGSVDGGEMTARVLSAVQSDGVGHTPVCLGVNRDGSPKHPLYIRADTMPIPYAAAARATPTDKLKEGN